MVKVITYGTFDLFHYGHRRLLERAKALGDYLIVGVTADDFDKMRGKINVQQSLIERIEAVRATGLADEIIVEEYEGQKIDDIKRFGVDIFTIGSDWVGKFDYLNEYCKVIYQDRTQGVSSSEIRAQKREITLGFVGESPSMNKFLAECDYVNGIKIGGLCSLDSTAYEENLSKFPFVTHRYEDLIDQVDAVYILSHPTKHYEQIKLALSHHKHVLCESPLALNQAQCEELLHMAKEQHCVLYEAIKTAYFTAYQRLLLLAKGGKIGRVVSVDAVCTSLRKLDTTNAHEVSLTWSSLEGWGPTALLPIFQLLGTQYTQKRMVSLVAEGTEKFDAFTAISFVYPHAVASIKVGKGVKSEGELIISGTEGYIYVPAPWWKTDYFEIRYENTERNKRYFYQLDGEGIRYEIVAFLKALEGKRMGYVTADISVAIARVMEDYAAERDVVRI